MHFALGFTPDECDRVLVEWSRRMRKSLRVWGVHCRGDSRGKIALSASDTAVVVRADNY